MHNVEIKSRTDRLARVRERAEALGAEWQWSRAQRDTFYGVPRGWLKLRESDPEVAELISYTRATDRSGPRLSAYDVAPLDDAGRWHRLLGRVLEVEAVVEKQRELWIWRHTRIHLDQVRGLGEFVELETVVRDITAEEAEAETHRVIEALALDPAQFLAVPYRELLHTPARGA